MYDPLDNINMIDPSWVRQRGPIERNIHIRTKHIEPLVIAKKQGNTVLHIMLMLICSMIFGFALMGLYEHALTRDHNPFNQEN